MATQTLGLDIGGANLKAAHSDGSARTVPFALWKHPEKLPAELRALSDTMPAYDRVAITMTGELCDCFENRSEGVRAILRASQTIYEESRIRVWSTHGRFLDLADAFAEPTRVASANWLAQAHYVARQFPTENALLIDTGSTTTDIVYLAQGKPQPRGLTDAERLASGELVYTGMRRTPICAVLGMQVVGEVFATMLDAYLYARALPENDADRDTADGRPATRVHAHARLARMRCRDADTFSSNDAWELADDALKTQWSAVSAAIQRVRAGRPPLQRIITAGSGEFLGQCVASQWPKIPTTSLAERLGPHLSEAACAYAVAMLASEE